MKKRVLAACLAALFGASPAATALAAAGTQPGAETCQKRLAGAFPERRAAARDGSEVIREIRGLRGPARDVAVAREVMAGNVPGFLRRLIPVTLTGATAGGGRAVITVCVTPDYLSVGSEEDFVRVPLGLPAAAAIAGELGFLLPTTRMVDAIHDQAEVRLAPAPMPPTAEMESTDYFWRHNRTVDEQRGRIGAVLTAGQKKDIVLSNRLRSKPGRVAIYGWHRKNGKPIQPLSTVHGKNYADYSHGLRLVSGTAFVNGEPRPLSEVLEDPQLAGIVSSEGPIARPIGLLSSLR